MPSGRTNNFPWKWAWPRSRDRTIFGIRSNTSPKLLELDTSNLVGGFVMRMPSRRTNNFPESGRGLGHVTTTIFGSTVGYHSDSLASCSQGEHNQLTTSIHHSVWQWLISADTSYEFLSIIRDTLPLWRVLAVAAGRDTLHHTQHSGVGQITGTNTKERRFSCQHCVLQ